MKKLVLDLVDEVWDVGEAIIVKNKNEEVRIPLAEIMNIIYSYITNPPRVSHMLRHQCRLGTEATFMPPTSLLPSRKSPIERVDAMQKDKP